MANVKVITWKQMQDLRDTLRAAILVCGNMWHPFPGKRYKFFLGMYQNSEHYTFRETGGMQRLCKTDLVKLQAIPCPVSQRAKQGHVYDCNMTIIVKCITTLKEYLS